MNPNPGPIADILFPSPLFVSSYVDFGVGGPFLSLHSGHGNQGLSHLSQGLLINNEWICVFESCGSQNKCILFEAQDPIYPLMFSVTHDLSKH